MSSNPNEWMNFYQQNPPTPTFSDDATAAATTTAATTSSAAQLRSSSSSGTANLSRVAKPIRRRSRASRRTPTTLLNTDTSNFRAMVQQFTGNPNALFSSSTTVSQYPNSMHNISFGVGSSRNIIQAPSQAQALVSPNIQHAPYHLQYQQQRSQPQPQPPMMFAANPDDVFLQRVRNFRPNMEVRGGGLTADHGSTPPADTGENRSNDSFMF